MFSARSNRKHGDSLWDHAKWTVRKSKRCSSKQSISSPRSVSHGVRAVNWLRLCTDVGAASLDDANPNHRRATIKSVISRRGSRPTSIHPDFSCLRATRWIWPESLQVYSKRRRPIISANDKSLLNRPAAKESTTSELAHRQVELFQTATPMTSRLLQIHRPVGVIEKGLPALILRIAQLERQ